MNLAFPGLRCNTGSLRQRRWLNFIHILRFDIQQEEIVMMNRIQEETGFRK